MKDGFIKVAAATPEIRVADVAYNTQKILECMKEAEAQGVQVLVLPELCLTGSTCGDLFWQRTLVEGAWESLKQIAAESGKMLTFLGLPVQTFGGLYNCAAAVRDGEILCVIPKQRATGAQSRWFADAPAVSSTITARGIPFGKDMVLYCPEQPDCHIAAVLGEELWSMDGAAERYASAGVTILANLAAEGEYAGRVEYCRMMAKAQSAKLVNCVVRAEAGDGESTTDLVFSGHNFICEHGKLLAEAKPFQNGMLVTETDVCRMAGERRRVQMPYEGIRVHIPIHMFEQETQLTRSISRSPFFPEDATAQAAHCEAIFEMQVNGLAKRITHTHAKTAVIGISGGLDSCLALLATARTMDALQRPRTDILAVTMPCFGTTSRTKSNAEVLCELLGVSFQTIEIAQSVQQHLQDIRHPEGVLDAAYENAQARERTQVLMDLANQTGGLVIGTGDLSELALGWATYNGDHMSMYGVNGDIPKTLVRAMVAHAAQQDPRMYAVLKDIIDTPVSPELLPAKENEIAQKTEDLVGPYELHDFFLYYVLRYGFAPAKIYRMAKHAFGEVFPAEVIAKWLKVFYRRFFSQQFKRSCLPDGPKVGEVSLSPRGGWQMPSDAISALWLQQAEAL